MTLGELRVKESVARKELDTLSDMVQMQHRLKRGDPLKLSYDQMTVLFDRLDAARKAHDAAYEAYDAAYLAAE